MRIWGCELFYFEHMWLIFIRFLSARRLNFLITYGLDLLLVLTLRSSAELGNVFISWLLTAAASLDTIRWCPGALLNILFVFTQFNLVLLLAFLIKFIAVWILIMGKLIRCTCSSFGRWGRVWGVLVGSLVVDAHHNLRRPIVWFASRSRAKLSFLARLSTFFVLVTCHLSNIF